VDIVVRGVVIVVFGSIVIIVVDVIVVRGVVTIVLLAVATIALITFLAVGVIPPVHKEVGLLTGPALRQTFDDSCGGNEATLEDR
jgi:hypothetical protein